MYKIAILGKANTGKNTAAMFIANTIRFGNIKYGHTIKYMAFADPIKEIIRIMFPFLKKKWLYGPSKFRNNIISGAIDSNGNPLTIRQSLLDVGTKLGRGYNNSMWLNIFERRFNKEVKKKTGLIIVNDVRFIDEFNLLKSKGFYMIRIIRDTEIKINHSSETDQDLIKDHEFNFVIDNNYGLNELISSITTKVVPDIKKIQG